MDCVVFSYSLYSFVIMSMHVYTVVFLENNFLFLNRYNKHFFNAGGYLVAAKWWKVCWSQIELLYAACGCSVIQKLLCCCHELFLTWKFLCCCFHPCHEIAVLTVSWLKSLICCLLSFHSIMQYTTEATWSISGLTQSRTARLNKLSAPNK